MRAGGIVMVLALTQACTQGMQTPANPFGTYLGAETRLLADDLVNFQVKMTGNIGPDALTDYADCVAARYT
ncbi:MAG: hypothetical protein AAF386_03015, partial [Pseudomonadota bacterium]